MRSLSNTSVSEVRTGSGSYRSERGRPATVVPTAAHLIAERSGPSGAPASSLFVGDFVIAAAQELDKTNAVTEGIGHVGDAAPIMRLDLALDRGAGFNCLADSSLKLRDDEIKMHWRPMSLTATHLACTC
jgi:hypothetical protein